MIYLLLFRATASCLEKKRRFETARKKGKKTRLKDFVYSKEKGKKKLHVTFFGKKIASHVPH